MKDPSMTTEMLIQGIRSGEDETLEYVFREYYDQLLERLQRGRKIQPKFKIRFDEHDVVATAFRTFVRGCKNGSIEVNGQGHLLPLLQQIINCKLSKKIKSAQAQKRDIDKEQSVVAVEAVFGTKPTQEENLLFEEVYETAQKKLEGAHDVLELVYIHLASDEEIKQQLPDVDSNLIQHVRRTLRKTVEDFDW
ncbi:MAG: ECF-type sigma factor [Planctomycetota bacterium]